MPMKDLSNSIPDLGASPLLMTHRKPKYVLYLHKHVWILNLTPLYRPGTDGVKSQSIIIAPDNPEIGSKRSLGNLQTGTIYIL